MKPVPYFKNHQPKFRGGQKKRYEVQERVNLILDCFSPDELVTMFEKENGFSLSKLVPDEPGAEKPRIFDLMILSQIIQGIKGKEANARLVMNYGFGLPESKLTLSDERGEPIDIPKEEKVAILKKLREMKAGKLVIEDATVD